MGLWDAGGATTWGELVALTREALTDPATRLGAKAAGWSYPATNPELLRIVADFGKRAHKVLPLPREGGAVSQAEADTAAAELEESIVFAD